MSEAVLVRLFESWKLGFDLPCEAIFDVHLERWWMTMPHCTRIAAGSSS